jgi:hypothetical protein
VDYSTVVAAGQFHLPGRHDQRDHGRRLDGLEGPVAEKAARWHQDLGPVSDLIRTIQSGQVGEPRPLGGGQFGDVDEVDFADGTTLIRKRPSEDGVEEVFGKSSSLTPARQCDAEQLVALMGAVFGCPVPKAVRTGEAEVFIEVAPGTPWAAFKSNPAVKASTLAEVEDEVAATPAGLRLGVLDLLTDNWDRRNPGNWMLQDDDTPVGIDQSFAFPTPEIGSEMDGSRPPKRENISQFSIAFLTFDDQGQVDGFDGTDLHPDDVAWLRARMDALKNDFEVLDRQDWYEFAVARLDALAQVASGTTRRFDG